MDKRFNILDAYMEQLEVRILKIEDKVDEMHDAMGESDFEDTRPKS